MRRIEISLRPCVVLCLLIATLTTTTSAQPRFEMTDLSELANLWAVPYAITDQGVVVGSGDLNGSGNFIGVAWLNLQAFPLNPLPTEDGIYPPTAT